MIIVALDYLDWSVCVGGRHFTGHVVVSEPYKRVEMERRLSLLEAHEEAAGQDYMYAHELPRVTNRFENWDSLVRAAIKWCDGNLAGSWMLVKGGYGGLSQVLAAKGVSDSRIRVLNLIWERWDRLDNWQRDDETMDAFYAAWRAWKP